MKLDLRRPTLVLAGAWNPAIFRPGWIAQHVFGVPAGVEVTAGVAQLIVDEQPQVIVYLNDVGFGVSSKRLDLFAVDVGKSAFNAVENAATKIVRLLPHTPISAYGINFYFIEEQPSTDLLKVIKGVDALDAHFDLAREKIISRINLAPAVQLNIGRENNRSNVSFDFNFHRSEVQVDKFVENIDGEIQERMEQALTILGDIYKLSKFEVIMHQFGSNQEEEGHGDNT